MLKYITDYWSQIAIIIAAFGYGLKVILDHRFKRKEIWYTLYSQKRMEYTLKYLELYYKLESKTLGITSVLKTGIIPDIFQHKDLDMLDLVNVYTEAGQILSCLAFFIEEKEYDNLKKGNVQIGNKIQKLNSLLQNSIQHNLLIEESELLYKETLTTIQNNNKMLLSLRK